VKTVCDFQNVAPKVAMAAMPALTMPVPSSLTNRFLTLAV
jgi:hypothetical protein